MVSAGRSTSPKPSTPRARAVLPMKDGVIKVAGYGGVGLDGNVENTYKAFAPRLSFAYHLTPRPSFVSAMAAASISASSAPTSATWLPRTFRCSRGRIFPIPTLIPPSPTIAARSLLLARVRRRLISRPSLAPFLPKGLCPSTALMAPRRVELARWFSVSQPSTSGTLPFSAKSPRPLASPPATSATRELTSSLVPVLPITIMKSRPVAAPTW